MKFLIVALSLLVSTQVLAKSKDCADETQYKDVTLAEMQKMSTDLKVTIIDVNSKSSFDAKHIGDARPAGTNNTIHFGSNKATLAKVLPKDKTTPIVTYCGGKSCGAWKDAAVAACKAGYQNIRHFSAGIKGWKAPKKG